MLASVLQYQIECKYISCIHDIDYKGNLKLILREVSTSLADKHRFEAELRPLPGSAGIIFLLFSLSCLCTHADCGW